MDDVCAERLDLLEIGLEDDQPLVILVGAERLAEDSVETDSGRQQENDDERRGRKFLRFPEDRPGNCVPPRPVVNG